MAKITKNEMLGILEDVSFTTDFTNLMLLWVKKEKSISYIIGALLCEIVDIKTIIKSLRELEEEKKRYDIK